MTRTKRLMAFLLSGAMCATLAFGAACSNSGDDDDDDNTTIENPDNDGSGSSDGDTGNTPTETVDNNDGVKGATSTTKSTYVQSVESILKDVLTSTTGYEITGSYDYSYSSVYSNGVKHTQKSDTDFTAVTKYADSAFNADVAIFETDSYSSDYTANGGSKSSNTYNDLTALRLRGADAYIGYDSNDATAFTSVPSDLFYDKTNIDDETEDMYSTLASYALDYVGGTIDSDTADIIDLIIDVVNSPLCAVYGTVTTTSGVTTLSYDLLKEADYILSSAKTISSLITEDTTAESLASNSTARALIEVYLAGITGKDIETMLTIAETMEVEVVSTIPTASDDQSAYDYLLAVLKQYQTDSEMQSISLSGYDEYIDEMVEMCEELFSAYTEFTLDLTFDANSTFTGFALSIKDESTIYDEDDSEDDTTVESHTVSEEVSISATIASKSVTLATVDNSYVYLDFDWADSEAYDSDVTVYYMADGKVGLRHTVKTATDDGYDYSYARSLTNLTYEMDDDGNVAKIGNNGYSFSNTENIGYGKISLTFTYNNVTYSIDNSVHCDLTFISANGTAGYYLYRKTSSSGDSEYQHMDIYLIDASNNILGKGTGTISWDNLMNSLYIHEGSNNTITIDSYQIAITYNTSEEDDSITSVTYTLEVNGTTYTAEITIAE